MGKNTGGVGFAMFILALVVACMVTCSFVGRAQDAIPVKVDEGYESTTLVAVTNAGRFVGSYAMWMDGLSYQYLIWYGDLEPGQSHTVNMRDILKAPVRGTAMITMDNGLHSDWIQVDTVNDLAYSGVGGELIETNHMLRFITTPGSFLAVTQLIAAPEEETVYCDGYPATIKVCPGDGSNCQLIQWYSNSELMKLGTERGYYEVDLGLALPQFSGGTIDICLPFARLWSVMQSEGRYSIALDEYSYSYPSSP